MCSNRLVKNGATLAESNNPCDEKLPVRPLLRRDGRRNKAVLCRREIPRAFIARFHTKYQRGAGCWLWTSGAFKHGYGMVNLGRFADGRQQTTYAHRVAYVLAHGDIPQGMVVMHSCDTPACVNPAHLSLGDQGDNIRDCFARGRHPGKRGRRVVA